jgi:hypothetical protein
MEPEVALVTAGVETDVLGIGYHDLKPTQIDAVVAAHPRPDFKRQILEAFTNGIKYRPETTFGNVKADVLEHFETIELDTGHASFATRPTEVLQLITIAADAL